MFLQTKSATDSITWLYLHFIWQQTDQN